MSYHNREARRISAAEVPPTCGKIDNAMKELESVVKDQTGDLRQALEEWIERALVAEERIEDLEKELSEKERD